MMTTKGAKSTAQERRIQTILNHVQVMECHGVLNTTMVEMEGTSGHVMDLLRLKSVPEMAMGSQERNVPNPEIDLLKRMMQGSDSSTRQVRETIREFLVKHGDKFDWRKTLDVSRKDYQEICNDWTVLIGTSGIMKVDRLRDRPAEFFAFFETMGFFEHSLALKFAVQYSLWGSTILNLGTEKHARKYLQRINMVQLPGIFGLTELGHGSNVRGTLTTATYDRKKKEFIIHTPSAEAQKYWPGHIFRYGEMGTFFAHLIIDGHDYGVHAFIVPVRDHRTKKLLPGRRVRDLGPKFGFNGIDNGCLAFDHVRIPLENMLDRFSEVRPDGTYVNKVGSANRHFGSVMFALCGGRIVIGTLALSAAKMALTIATRYAHQREQFGPENGPEVKLIEHVSYHCRLMPQLVRCFTADMLLKHATNVYDRRDQLEPNHTHIITSLAKIHASAFAVEACRVARESCGGQGYRSINRIPHMYESADMYTAGEGDNIALHQTVVKALLSTYAHQKKTAKFSGLLSYLNDQHKGQGARYKLESQVSLKNLDYLQDAFQFRERSLLLNLVHYLDPSHSQTDNFDRFNDNQVLVMQLSQAFMDRLIVEICQQMIDDAAVCSGSDKRQVISSILELDCLQRFKDGLAWFVSHEYILPSVAREIDDVHQDLCRKVALVSYELTSTFGIPGMCLPEETLVDNWFEMDSKRH